jgi:hypothetical protein
MLNMWTGTTSIAVCIEQQLTANQNGLIAVVPIYEKILIYRHYIHFSTLVSVLCDTSQMSLRPINILNSSSNLLDYEMGNITFLKFVLLLNEIYALLGFISPFSVFSVYA